MELEHNHIGSCICTSYCGCPAYADNVALLIRCENELQCMANVLNRKQNRVTIHPAKSNGVLLKNHKSVTKKNVKVELKAIVCRYLETQLI